MEDGIPPGRTHPVCPEPGRASSRRRVRIPPPSGIALFNACRENVDVTPTPGDVLRPERRLKPDFRESVAGYTLPFGMDTHGTPGLKPEP